MNCVLLWNSPKYFRLNCFRNWCIVVFVTGGKRPNGLSFLHNQVPSPGWALCVLGFGMALQGLRPGGVCHRHRDPHSANSWTTKAEGKSSHLACYGDCRIEPRCASLGLFMSTYPQEATGSEKSSDWIIPLLRIVSSFFSSEHQKAFN